MTRAIVVIEGDLADIRRIRKVANEYQTTSAVWRKNQINPFMPGIPDGYRTIWGPIRDAIDSAIIHAGVMRRG